MKTPKIRLKLKKRRIIPLSLFLTLNIFLLSFFPLKAEASIFNDCPTGDIVLNSQQAVDDFGTIYPDCTELPGSLKISGSDITDLTPLSSIEKVDGTLQIEGNGSLLNVDAFSNLTEVGGDFRIESNFNLENLDGFSNLQTLGGFLAVIDNRTIPNIDSLINIASTVQALYIIDNSVLENIDGVSNLTTVVGEAYIQNNRLITNLDGLSNLNVVGGPLYITSNQALTDFSGICPLFAAGFSESNLVQNNNSGTFDPNNCPPIFDESDYFITTWQTTMEDESITIPTTGAGYNYLIDWGMGQWK